MKCTVLGGKGFIGRHLVGYLKSMGCDVFVPDRNDPRLFGQPLGHVFYCIGLTGDFRSRPFDTVKAHVTVLSELLQNAEFGSLLYLSSTRVYGRSIAATEDDALPIQVGDPSDLYNASKLMGESLCLSSGKKEIRVARLSNVVGLDMGVDNFIGGLMKEACSGLIQLRTHPDSVKDYVLIDDVVRMLWSIANEGRERIYNVASGMQIEHRQWMGALREVTGCQVQVDTQAPLQSFPAIDVQRIRNEFGFVPTPVLDETQRLLRMLTIKRI